MYYYVFKSGKKELSLFIDKLKLSYIIYAEMQHVLQIKF